MIKDPGPGGMRLRQVALDMSFAEPSTAQPDAYERLLLDVIRGNQTLFMRRDEVEAAWQWIDPISKVGNGATKTPDLYRRHLGAVGLRRADRTRWTNLA